MICFINKIIYKMKFIIIINTYFFSIDKLMTLTLNPELILNNLIKGLGSKLFFALFTSENGVVIKSYINEDEFNKAAIGVNISQLYETAEEVIEEIGIHTPDFCIIHSDNFYVISIKLVNRIIILLTQDQVDINEVFEIINKSTIQS